ncbi:unnamed protein product [Parnassius apollo]|uniref:(apollo) hypothetical protein n=1 Tax=Parnassius apollo TaxID=110799 RepID=A0A8S3WX64_PARAO|nr:unnamed protein product [Parnassius apollo]
MSKLRKCCVVGCNANNKTHRLFNFPKDDKLRELWLSFLVPVNIKLSGLSKEQLLNRYVCQKHFDRQQFDGVGNRLAHGYPCLFTAREMMHGIPLDSSTAHALSDHNYGLPIAVLEDSNDFTTNTIINSQDHISDHNYVLECNVEKGPPIEEPTNSKTDGHTCVTDTLQITKPVEIVPNLSIASSKAESRDVIRNVEQNQKRNSPKRIKCGANKLTKDCRCFIRRMKNIAVKENKLEKPFSERFDAAKILSHNLLFNKSFGKMTQQAQDFLLMQLKMASKKKKAMRYTTNEKLLSLSLMKESPKGYRLLQKNF